MFIPYTFPNHAPAIPVEDASCYYASPKIFVDTMPSSSIRQPFLKWAGSKTKLMKTLKPLLPEGDFRLIEPFAGSGAVFFNTRYPRNLICDSNCDLISLFSTLKEKREAVMQECQDLFQPLNNQDPYYYKLRAEFNASTDPVRRGALFVYLNRHCYNGLCRYNSKGVFNTPFGRYDYPRLPRKEMLAFAGKLEMAELKQQDFRLTFAEAGEGDVVYCDPPYAPLTPTARFTKYAPPGFTEKDQEDLARLCQEAANRGASVLISNHDTPYTQALYQSARRIIPVLASRTISCIGGKRQKAKELIAVF